MGHNDRPPIIFSGNAHPALEAKICEYLRIESHPVEVFKFKNDNTFVRIMLNVRERDVFIVQPTVQPVNDHIMELLIMVDACVRASAGRVTAVIPYYSYARTDKKDQPRVPITGRLIADLLKTAGASRAILMDLHAGQVQGFFSFPVDELSALPTLVNYFKARDVSNHVVVAPDVGVSKRARDIALALNIPLAIVEKRRASGGDVVEMFNVIGDVKGRTAILVDDEIATGGTMVTAARALAEHGATGVSIAATHPVLVGDCLAKLAALENVKEIVVTDTLPLPPDHETVSKGKLKPLSVAPLFAEAILRINEGRSVGALFNGHD